MAAEPDRDVTRSVALVCTIAAGLLVGLQPASNAALSEHVGDLGAAVVSLLVAAAIIGVLLLVAGHPGRLTGVTGIRPEHLVGALGGAAVVAIGLAPTAWAGLACTTSRSASGDCWGWRSSSPVPCS